MTTLSLHPHSHCNNSHCTSAAPAPAPTSTTRHTHIHAMLTKQLQHALGGGNHISYRLTPPQSQQRVDVIFLHGLLSDMRGTKSRKLEEHAQQQGHGFLCYDARGHGSSSGTLQDTALAEWYEDARTALTQLAPAERHILVGSSFGGWQALHLALDHPDKVAGLVLIAPALDFTARIWSNLSPEQQHAAEQQDRLSLGSSWAEGGQIHVRMKFIRDAERFLVLDRLRELQLRCPVHILHGMQDDAVPVSVSQRLFDQLPADQVLALVKDGDHRLSRPQDLQLMLAAVDGMLQRTANH